MTWFDIFVMSSVVAFIMIAIVTAIAYTIIVVFDDKDNVSFATIVCIVAALGLAVAFAVHY